LIVKYIFLPKQKQGYMLGNPVTYMDFEQNFRIPYAYGMGLISDEIYEV